MLALIRHGVETHWLVSGSADMEGTAITRQTRFRVGSITKPIVAAMVLLAVEQGTFGLDDDVGSVLPGVLRPNPPVTVRQVLDHTAGIFNEGDEGDPIADVALIEDPEIRAEAMALVEAYTAGEPIALTDRVWVALAETHDRYFAPGTGSHYTNAGYQVLGMILEAQTGKDLAQLLDEWIVTPLGLAETSIAPADSSTPDMHGYDPRRQKGVLTDITDDTAWMGNGAHGGVIATADELATTITEIVSGDLLPADLRAEMRKPHLAPYGLGLATYELDCGTFYGHGGSVLGTQSLALASLDGHDSVVIAVNITSDRDPQLTALANTLLCST